MPNFVILPITHGSVDLPAICHGSGGNPHPLGRGEQVTVKR
ncbi:hypothetical protein D082_32760 [Synechocystis sp. PCC 6714]|nr:hypothetical protein D082_32760 [Synechocystis sp. PCC 6714]